MSNSPAPIPSIAVASPEELSQIFAKTERERTWYANHFRFADSAAIAAAVESGVLVFIAPTENVVPTGRLRNPELIGEAAPYLLPESRTALNAIGSLWRAELRLREIDDSRIRLSTSSLVRSEVIQAELVATKGKLATEMSTHCVGATFDIDASAYYSSDHTTEFLSVVHPDRDRDAMQRIGARLMGEVSQPYVMPDSIEVFDPQVIDALLDVTAVLHDKGFINRVVEFVGSSNQCLHISPNPAVDFAAIGV